MAENFPTLSKNPNYPMQKTYEDSAIKSTMESGYVHARSRYTKNRYSFDIVYNNAPDTDHDLLWAFVATVKGSVDTFTWTDPYSGTPYTVRFDAPPSFELVDFNQWNIKFKLVTV